MMIFFLSPDGRVYARYGARDGSGPDERQSLDGLHYTMQSVLAMHQRADKEFAPREDAEPRYVRQIRGGRQGRGCVHCHNVREMLNDELKRSGKWSRDLAYRYPMPDNLGVLLEVNRGNVVRQVRTDSPAARAGLQPGDVLHEMGSVPIHSIADVTFALDRAPQTGTIAVSWTRAEAPAQAMLELPQGWRKTDISWRPSLLRLVPFLPLYGKDLSAEEKKACGLSANRMAFRQKEQVHSRAKAAGIRGGDIIIGVDDRPMEGADVDLHEYLRKEHLVGDRIIINVLRDGKELRLPCTLQ
jgi:S1-C subfamily serine protease